MHKYKITFVNNKEIEVEAWNILEACVKAINQTNLSSYEEIIRAELIN